VVDAQQARQRRESGLEEAQEFQLSPDDLNMVSELSRPGIKDSTILTLDSVLTLMRLFKAEAGRALGSLPALVALNIARAPVYLMVWVCLSIFAACVAYVVFDHLLAGAGVLLLMQLGLAGLLEWKLRRLHTNLEFNESRKGLAVLQASVKERLKREHAS
jgi:hypothetical protein